MSRTTKSIAISVRIPTELYESIRTMAEHEDRSIGGQIVNLLRKAVASHHAE